MSKERGVFSLIVMLAACGDDAGDALERDAGARDAALPTLDASRDANEPDSGALLECRLLEQAGCDSDAKCAIVTSASGAFEADCVELYGSTAEGEACRRIEGFGRDDCAPGLFCSFIGELGPDQGGTRRCHAHCDADAQCAEGERCAVLVNSQGAGFCGPSCEPFAVCGEDLTCGDLYTGEGGALDFWLACRPIGPLATGDACSTAYECPADHVCTDPNLGASPVCTALCDDEHACERGNCQRLGERGFCVPSSDEDAG